MSANSFRNGVGFPEILTGIVVNHRSHNLATVGDISLATRSRCLARNWTTGGQRLGMGMRFCASKYNVNVESIIEDGSILLGTVRCD